MKVPTPQTWWPESWRISNIYDRIELGAPRTREVGYRMAYDERKRNALNMVFKAFPPPARVLDCAAAQGNMSLALAEAGYSVVWNDIREDLIDYVKLKQDRAELEFWPGNIWDRRPVPEFDVVIALEVIEHVAHPDRLLSHLSGFMKEDGLLVVSTPNGRYIRNDLPRFSDCDDPSMYEGVQFGPGASDHIFLLDMAEIRQLAAAAGLEVCDFRVSGNPLTSGHMKLWLLHPLMPRAAIRRLDRATRRLPFANALHASLSVAFRHRKAGSRARTLAGPPSGGPS